MKAFFFHNTPLEERVSLASFGSWGTEAYRVIISEVSNYLEDPTGDIYDLMFREYLAQYRFKAQKALTSAVSASA